MGKHLQWSRPSKVTSQSQKFLKVPPVNYFSIFRETNLTAQKMNFSITEENLIFCAVPYGRKKAKDRIITKINDWQITLPQEYISMLMTIKALGKKTFENVLDPQNMVVKRRRILRKKWMKNQFFSL